jgi:hypothetical protein
LRTKHRGIIRGSVGNSNNSSSEPGPAAGAAQPALAEQVRAWSGPLLMGLGGVIAYRAVAAGAVVAGLTLGIAMAGLGALRSYYLFRYLRPRKVA